VQSRKGQGQGALEPGLANLGHHIASVRKFGAPVVVAINHFPNDGAEDLQRIQQYCTQAGLSSALVDAFSKGGAGATDLAALVVEAAEKSSNAQPIYSLDKTLEEKVRTVATEIYGAADVSFTDAAQEKLRHFTELGFGNLPVCMAKTQYSLSDDPALLGAPTGWTLRVNDAILSAGAGFVVVASGNIMLMPGLPKAMRALDIDVDEDGKIIGV